MRINFKKEFSIKSLISIFFLVLIIILIFSFVDYLFHSTSSRWAVPDYYFNHKIIYGTIIGFITYFFIRKQKPIIKSLILSATISILLQINYYLQGYPKDFVFIFLGIHFIILFVVSLIAFKLIKNL